MNTSQIDIYTRAQINGLTLEQRVEWLERLFHQSQIVKDYWVGPTVITKPTGWNSSEMVKTRRNGSVKYKRKVNAYLYMLNSIPLMFLKNEPS